jgi:hypothetical protein
MPRLLEPTGELERVEKLLKTDPDATFLCTTKLPAQTYIRLLQECNESGKPLTHQLATICTDYFRMKDQAGLPNLDADGQHLIKCLSVLWSVTPEEAVRKLVERTALKVLDEELAVRERAKDLLRVAEAKS